MVTMHNHHLGSLYKFRKIGEIMKPIVFDKLTDREKDVMRIMHFGRKNDLGLSPAYFQEILNSARDKLGLNPDSKVPVSTKKRYK